MGLTGVVECGDCVGGLDSGGGRNVVGGGRGVVVPVVAAATAAASAMAESRFRMYGLICLVGCKLQNEHYQINARNRRFPNANW